MQSSHHAEVEMAICIASEDDDDAQYEEGQDDDDDQENLNDYDQEQEELGAESEESAEQSDDSAPHFSQIKHLLKSSQTESEKQLNKDDEVDLITKQGNEEQRMTKWMTAADKINRALQAAAGLMTKEAQTINLGAQYVLNSYAFHSRQLVNTIQAYLPPGFDKSKIETLFVENNVHENTHQELLLFAENLDKIRKRVLISSTFATASKAKHVLNIFEQLRNCKQTAPQLFKRAGVLINQSTNTAVATNFAQPPALNAQRDSFQQLQITQVQPVQQRVFRKELLITLTSLTQKYDPNNNGVSQVTPSRKSNIIVLPSMPEPMKKPKNLDLDDFSEDEQYYKHRNQMLKYNSWRFSLLCSKNVVYMPREELESPKKDSSSKMVRHKGSENQGRSPKALGNKKSTNSQFTQQVLQQQQQNQDMYGRTISPSGKYINTNSGARYFISPNAHNQTGPYNRISHKSNKLDSDQSSQIMSECPVHSHPLNQNPIGLTQFDLGSVIDNLGGRSNISQMQATPVQKVNQDKSAQQKEKYTTQQNGKIGFANNNRTQNPFKQDRNQAQVSQQVMTINGVKKQYSRGAVITNSQKKIAYDPNIIAHMAKMYMVPTHQQHKQVQAAMNKKSLFPQHIQQQLLMNDDEPATIYNRQNGPRQDALMQRAVEDLMKKKIMFQAANAQQLYSQIYNTEVQILCTEQGQLQYQREIASGPTKPQFETGRASQAYPQNKEVNHHRKTNSVLVGSTDRYPKEHFKRESHMSGKTGIAQQQGRLNKREEDFEIASKKSNLQQHNSQSQRRRHIQAVRQRGQSLSQATELTPKTQQHSMPEKQIQSIDVEFEQNNKADFKLDQSQTNPSSKQTQAHQQYHRNIPQQNHSCPPQNKVKLSSATENNKSKSNFRKTINKQGSKNLIDLTNKDNDFNSIQDIKDKQSSQVRHQTEKDRNSIVYNHLDSSQSDVSHPAKAVLGMEGSESITILASAITNSNQFKKVREQEHKLSRRVNGGISNISQTKAPSNQNLQNHKQAQVNQLESTKSSSYEDQITNIFQMQPGQHGMHQVQKVINLEVKDQGSSTNLHTTEQIKLSQQSNSLFKNHQQQAQQSKSSLGQDIKNNGYSKTNSIGSQQESNSEVNNSIVIPQNQKEQMAFRSKQQIPHQTSNKLHSSENFTNKLQKIKRTKPHQSSSPIMMQNQIQDPSQQNSMPRHLNYKAEAQSPTKMTQRQGSLNSPQILSSMQQSKVLGSSRHPSSEIMDATHDLKFKQSSNDTKLTSQQPENYIRHKTHQLNVTSSSRNEAVDSSSMSRISTTNKSRSCIRKKTQSQQSNINMDSHQLSQPQAPSAKQSRFKQDSKLMATVKDQVVSRIPSKLETNSNNENFLEQVQIQGTQVNPLSSNSKSKDRQQILEQLKIRQSSNKTSTKNNQPLTSSTKETINLNSLGSSRKSYQAPSSYNNCNQPLSSQSQSIQNMYHKRKLTMGETNSQYRQIVDKTQALQNLSQTRQIIPNETSCQKQQTKQHQLQVVKANRNTSSLKQTKNLEKPMQSTLSNIMIEKQVYSIKGATTQSNVQRIFHNVESEYQVDQNSSINRMIAPNTTQLESLKLKNSQNQTHQDKQISYKLKSSNRSYNQNNASQTRVQVDLLKSQQQSDIIKQKDRQTLATKQQRHLSHETHQIPTHYKQDVQVAVTQAQQSNVKFKKTEGPFHQSGLRQRVWLQEDPANNKASSNQDYIDQTGQRQKGHQSNDPYNIQKIQKIGKISNNRQQLITSKRESTNLPKQNVSSQRLIWQAPVVLPNQQFHSPRYSQAESLGKTMPSLSNRTGGIIQTSQRIAATKPFQQSDTSNQNCQRVYQPRINQTSISNSHMEQKPQTDSISMQKQNLQLQLSMLDQKPKQNTLTCSNLIPKESIMYSNNPMGK